MILPAVKSGKHSKGSMAGTWHGVAGLKWLGWESNAGQLIELHVM